MLRPVLLAMLLLFIGGTDARAQDWIGEVLGGYQGPVMNGGQIEQLSTEFARDGDGRLIGHYHVEDEPPFDGDLTDFRADGPMSGSFVWRDRYGVGIVHVVFDPAHGRFVGSWGSEAPSPGLIFNGYRIRPPAVS